MTRTIPSGARPVVRCHPALGATVRHAETAAHSAAGATAVSRAEGEDSSLPAWCCAPRRITEDPEPHRDLRCGPDPPALAAGPVIENNGGEERFGNKP
ncbi:hypothetical protein ACFYWN_10680 [Streptomyces sp. NPDC002917]|uniref:hypothetical protein n=1 Tax=unclassified Streptomyces TaxID=2593676 RepID=UPI0033BE93D5